MRRWSCRLIGAKLRTAELLGDLNCTTVHWERKRLRESSLVDKKLRAALKEIKEGLRPLLRFDPRLFFRISGR
jgi:hypothetical protein